MHSMSSGSESHDDECAPRGGRTLVLSIPSLLALPRVWSGKDSRFPHRYGWRAPVENSPQNETVAVMEIVRDAPSQAAFSVMAER